MDKKIRMADWMCGLVVIFNAGISNGRTYEEREFYIPVRAFEEGDRNVGLVIHGGGLRRDFSMSAKHEKRVSEFIRQYKAAKQTLREIRKLYEEIEILKAKMADECPLVKEVL